MLHSHTSGNLSPQHLGPWDPHELAFLLSHLTAPHLLPCCYLLLTLMPTPHPQPSILSHSHLTGFPVCACPHSLFTFSEGPCLTTLAKCSQIPHPAPSLLCQPDTIPLLPPNPAKHTLLVCAGCLSLLVDSVRAGAAPGWGPAHCMAAPGTEPGPYKVHNLSWRKEHGPAPTWSPSVHLDSRPQTTVG